MGDFDRLGDLVREVTQTAGRFADGSSGPRSSPADSVARRLSEIWGEVVGSEIAAHARPLRLKQGRLAVATSSSVWAHALQLMAADIVSRLNATLGDVVVEEAVFRAAGWEGSRDIPSLVRTEEPRGVGRGEGCAGQNPRQSDEALTEAQREVIRTAVSDSPDPVLGQRMARAMEAAFRRECSD